MKKKISLHEDNLFLTVYLYLLDVFSAFQKSRFSLLFYGV